MPTNFDNCESFFIDNGVYRGRLIRLDKVINTILSKQQYPLPIAAVIAESTALGAVLASLLKYEGLFTLQIQSNGIINLVVVDVTSQGKIRAYARFDQDHLASSQKLRKTDGQIEPAPHLLGGGNLAFTVDQGSQTELYQGVVDLQGKTLAECALRYFKQSEQIDTALKLFLKAPQGESQSWLSAAILLQKMPSAGSELSPEEQQESWNEAQIFMDSLTEDEVFNADLTSADILHRLFHANNLQLSPTQNYQFGCRCSREKLLQTLQTFSADEISSMIENNQITATCNFCGEHYNFAPGEIRKQ